MPTASAKNARNYSLSDERLHCSIVVVVLLDLEAAVVLCRAGESGGLLQVDSLPVRRWFLSAPCALDVAADRDIRIPTSRKSFSTA